MARRVRGSVANDQSSSCRLLVIIALITRGRGGLDPLLHSASIICFVCPPTPGRAASAYNSVCDHWSGKFVIIEVASLWSLACFWVVVYIAPKKPEVKVDNRLATFNSSFANFQGIFSLCRRQRCEMPRFSQISQMTPIKKPFVGQLK